jgi:hypothetical protein
MKYFDRQFIKAESEDSEYDRRYEILMTLQELPICRVEIDPYKNLHIGLGKQ